MSAALSKTGARRLADAESKIERGLSTFWEVGNALMQIRDERLYRADFPTFEDYCQQRWSMTRRRANQLVEAAQMGTMVPIENERQARALAPVKEDPAEVREIYAEAKRRGDTSGAGLASVVAERKPPANIDPETGEIAEEEGTPLATGSGMGGDVAPGQTREASSPSSPRPPIDPALRLMADLSARRAEVAKWLAFDRHEQVIESMSQEQRDDYRSFCLSVFNHASATIDHLDAPARLKAVQ